MEEIKLLPAHEYMDRILKNFPRLEAFVEVLGSGMAGALFESLAGEWVYFPNQSKLEKLMRDEVIYRALKGKRYDGQEYAVEVKRLSHLLGLSEKSIKHLHNHLKNG